MIHAKQFVEAAKNKGFKWYAGVPCSFLTPFINYIINDDSLTYISSANEGDALASAAGATIGGQPTVVMMQNSGLGNAINPLASLTYIFHIPLLIICTLRGDPTLRDEPQHELMGRVTGKLFDTLDLPWEFFPVEGSEIDAVLQRAQDYMHRERRPYALIMRKGSVAPCGLEKRPFTDRETATIGVDIVSCGPLTPKLDRSRVLQHIVTLTETANTVIIATTGYTGRELFALADRSNHLYMVGSMGCASSMALGLSMARPDLKVVVIDGDGAALMRMGNLATIGAYGRPNLFHILLDNEVHDSTGGQATVSAGVSFAHIAAACGYGNAMAGNSLSVVDALFSQDSANGPRFAHLKITPGTQADIPRPKLS
ncbi:MAG: phosphonopyruvate decarboxylase, partial [Pseudomonadota bacterium]